MRLILLLSLIFANSCFGQISPELHFYRNQDTSKNSYGYYLGKSTGGHFMVLMPAPFNDYYVKYGRDTVQAVGCKNGAGVSFVVTETAIIERNKVDLSDAVSKFVIPGNEVEICQTDVYSDYSSIFFTVKDKNKGAFIKYLVYRGFLFTLIMEYPIRDERVTAKSFAFYFSSFSFQD
jgi:hypothetical protein